MARRKHRSKPAKFACVPTAGAKRQYKQCIVRAMKGTKITTAKSAQKAFNRAARKCRVLVAGTVRKARRKGRKRVRRARRRSTRRFIPPVFRRQIMGLRPDLWR